MGAVAVPRQSGAAVRNGFGPTVVKKNRWHESLFGAPSRGMFGTPHLAAASSNTYVKLYFLKTVQRFSL
jgi:hypothetical protein